MAPSAASVLRPPTRIGLSWRDSHQSRASQCVASQCGASGSRALLRLPARAGGPGLRCGRSVAWQRSGSGIGRAHLPPPASRREACRSMASLPQIWPQGEGGLRSTRRPAPAAARDLINRAPSGSARSAVQPPDARLAPQVGKSLSLAAAPRNRAVPPCRPRRPAVRTTRPSAARSGGATAGWRVRAGGIPRSLWPPRPPGR